MTWPSAACPHTTARAVSSKSLKPRRGQDTGHPTGAGELTALTIARELLRCRLLEGGHDVLLERVAELLATAASGAPPFCVHLPPQIQGGPYGGTMRAHATPSGLQGLLNANPSISTGRQVVPAPSPAGEGAPVAAFGLGGPPCYYPQDSSPSRTAWRVGHYGEALGAMAPEAYVPHMVDQECALEEDHGSFLGPGWGEETSEAELFQEPQ